MRSHMKQSGAAPGTGNAAYMAAVLDFTPSGHFPLLSSRLRWVELPGLLPIPEHICPGHSCVLVPYCAALPFLLHAHLSP